MVAVLSRKSLKKRYKFYEKHSNKNSKYSILMRYVFVKATAKKCGDNVYIGKHAILKNVEYIEFGENVSIHEFSYVDGGHGLSIGSNVSIAHGCSIIASNHGFSLNETPFKYQEMHYKPIIIGNNVWMGAKSIVLAGATICDNVVIAAGTICTSKQKLKSGALYAGCPAAFKKDIK